MKSAERLASHLLVLGLKIREHIIRGRDVDLDRHAVAETAGDTIFAIDRRVEPLILDAMAALPADLLPILVVCEGLGEDGRRRFGPAIGPILYRILIDPIDGTRSLMYDKRSAWFLAVAAPDRGEGTRLSDAVASVMVELPTSKQGLADHFLISGGAVEGVRQSLTGGAGKQLIARPSSEPNLRHGFGQVASFFPGTKTLAAELMERIATATLGTLSISEASIFDDQYICTGGQLVELMTGRDRFCCDLRPIFYEILQQRGGGNPQGLCCHPYDMAGLPIALGAGVLVTDGFGKSLDAPFDVETPVHWCGYANAALRATIEPVIQGWISSNLN